MIAHQDSAVDLDTYDAGLLGGDEWATVEWWHDYMRSELARAHEFYADQFEADDLVHTLREQRDELLEAAERMLPNNIALGNDAWPDSQLVPIDFTLGELRALRAAIAKARSNEPDMERGL